MRVRTYASYYYYNYNYYRVVVSGRGSDGVGVHDFASEVPRIRQEFRIGISVAALTDYDTHANPINESRTLCFRIVTTGKNKIYNQSTILNRGLHPWSMVNIYRLFLVRLAFC